jgi:hypothetical protein
MSRTQSLRELSHSQSHNLEISSPAVVHVAIVSLIAFSMSSTGAFSSSKTFQTLSSAIIQFEAKSTN